MPNWIEGTLKLRGNIDDILRFFREGLNVYEWNGPDTNDYTIIDKSTWYKECDYRDSEDAVEIYIENASPHIEGTGRAFVEGDQCLYIKCNREGHATISMNFRQAWAFQSSVFVKIARDYNLDIRAYGIEQGMQFCQEFEIINGGVVFDHKTTYDDWEWECPFPRMGG